MRECPCVRERAYNMGFIIHLTSHLSQRTHIIVLLSLHCLGDLRCCILIWIIITFAGGFSRPLVYLCKVNVFSAAVLWFPWWFIEGEDQKNLQGETQFFGFIADCRGHRGSKINNGQNALWIWGFVYASMTGLWIRCGGTLFCTETLSISISFQIHLQSSVFSAQLQRIPECGSVIYYICAVNVEHKMRRRSIMDRMTCCLPAHISFCRSLCEQKCRGKDSRKSGGNGKKARSRIGPNALFKSSLRGIHYTSCLLRQPSCGQRNINSILSCRSWANISVVHRPAANAPFVFSHDPGCYLALLPLCAERNIGCYCESVG